MAEKIDFDLVVKNNEIATELNKASKASEELEKSIKSASGVLSTKTPNNTIQKSLIQATSEAEKLEASIKDALNAVTKPAKSSGLSEQLKQNTLSAQEFKVGAGAAFDIAKSKSKELVTSLKEVADVKYPLTGIEKLGESLKSSFSLGGISQTAIGFLTGNILINSLSTLTGAFKDSAKEAVDFKRSLLEIETILPNNAKVTDQMSKSLQNLATQYGTSASSQAKAYYEVISAGVEDAADATKLLSNANQLATGGITDTASTIDLLTTIYNVYGKEIATTEEASDSLFKTVQIGKTTIQELAQDFGKALPIAKSFGLSLDETGSIIAQFTNAGIKTAESVTLLNSLLSAIAKNGKELGKGFDSTAVQTEGLGVVLERLKNRTNGSNDALFTLLGRQEAVRAVQTLTSKGLEKYNSTLAEFSKKAGVAASASEKILSQDLGKQFDILGSKISQSASNFVSIFIPATLSATKALNAFFTSGTIDTQKQVEAGFEQVRKKISQLDALFASGRISIDAYTISSNKLKTELAEIANAADTAKAPLITLVSVTQGEIDSLTASITRAKVGLDNFGLPTDIATDSLDVLNAKLADAEKRLIDLKKIETPSGAGVAPDNRSKEAIEAERKLQADLFAIRVQFASDQQTFEEQLVLAEQDLSITRGEVITQQLYDQKIREADAVLAGEKAKNALITDEVQKNAANQIAIEKNEEARKAAARNKELTDLRNATNAKIALEKSYQDSRNTLIGQGFTLAATLAKDGSKTQFAIQKAAALAEIAIGDGKARALIPAQTALVPFPANLAAAAQLNAYVSAQTALGVAIVGASAIKGFAGGGIVGASDGPDNRVATVRDGEMILNASQQKKLFDAIDSGASGGDIVVQIDGMEVFRAIKRQLEAGARFT
jgi:TP901 family phage tail tape measure protein